jgi:hypothetical protein
MQKIRSLIDGETKRCQNVTDDADKDAMQRIHSLIEERMKSKLLASPTPAVQVSACIVDENDGDDTGNGALEERKIRRQCEQEEHLGQREAVGLEGQKAGEVTAAGMSSLQIDEAPSIHVPMERESTVEHERKSQHRESEYFLCFLLYKISSPYFSFLEISLLLHWTGDGFRKSNGEEKGMERKAISSEDRKDKEVSAARKSSMQIDVAPSMHVPMDRECAVEHERRNQHRESECIFCFLIYNVLSVFWLS